MAESDKSPKPKVELGTPVPAPKTQTEGKEQGKAGNAASGDSGAAGSAAAGFSRVSAWVGKTFPGHENAFWGGVFGLVAAVVLLAFGILKTLVVAVLVVAVFALGKIGFVHRIRISALK